MKQFSFGAGKSSASLNTILKNVIANVDSAHKKVSLYQYVAQLFQFLGDEFRFHNYKKLKDSSYENQDFDKLIQKFVELDLYKDLSQYSDCVLFCHNLANDLKTIQNDKGYQSRLDHFAEVFNNFCRDNDISMEIQSLKIFHDLNVLFSNYYLNLDDFGFVSASERINNSIRDIKNLNVFDDFSIEYIELQRLQDFGYYNDLKKKIDNIHESFSKRSQIDSLSIDKKEFLEKFSESLESLNGFIQNLHTKKHPLLDEVKKVLYQHHQLVYERNPRLDNSYKYQNSKNELRPFQFLFYENFICLNAIKYQDFYKNRVVRDLFQFSIVDIEQFNIKANETLKNLKSTFFHESNEDLYKDICNFNKIINNLDKCKARVNKYEQRRSSSFTKINLNKIPDNKKSEFERYITASVVNQLFGNSLYKSKAGLNHHRNNSITTNIRSIICVIYRLCNNRASIYQLGWESEVQALDRTFVEFLSLSRLYKELFLYQFQSISDAIEITKILISKKIENQERFDIVSDFKNLIESDTYNTDFFNLFFELSKSYSSHNTSKIHKSKMRLISNGGKQDSRSFDVTVSEIPRENEIKLTETNLLKLVKKTKQIDSLNLNQFNQRDNSIVLLQRLKQGEADGMGSSHEEEGGVHNYKEFGKFHDNNSFDSTPKISSENSRPSRAFDFEHLSKQSVSSNVLQTIRPKDESDKIGSSQEESVLEDQKSSQNNVNQSFDSEDNNRFYSTPKISSENAQSSNAFVFESRSKLSSRSKVLQTIPVKHELAKIESSQENSPQETSPILNIKELGVRNDSSGSRKSVREDFPEYFFCHQITPSSPENKVSTREMKFDDVKPKLLVLLEDINLLLAFNYISEERKRSLFNEIKFDYLKKITFLEQFSSHDKSYTYLTLRESETLCPDIINKIEECLINYFVKQFEILKDKIVKIKRADNYFSQSNKKNFSLDCLGIIKNGIEGFDLLNLDDFLQEFDCFYIQNNNFDETLKLYRDKKMDIFAISKVLDDAHQTLCQFNQLIIDFTSNYVTSCSSSKDVVKDTVFELLNKSNCLDKNSISALVEKQLNTTPQRR